MLNEESIKRIKELAGIGLKESFEKMNPEMIKDIGLLQTQYGDRTLIEILSRIPYNILKPVIDEMVAPSKNNSPFDSEGSEIEKDYDSTFNAIKNYKGDVDTSPRNF